jgi:hypothetical protein
VLFNTYERSAYVLFNTYERSAFVLFNTTRARARKRPSVQDDALLWRALPTAALPVVTLIQPSRLASKLL